MKPTALDITRQGSLGGESVDMTFDPHSIAHIMSVLTDLYSDQELAVIREYSTNAHDSHVEAGQQRPIEVTTPTALSPYFIVQDYGIGMSVQDIVDVYSKYGASTKRDSNAQTGMLGLGGKSALTYTAQFTVTAVKDGIKTIVNVGRKEDGTGVMEIVDTVQTYEQNGVQIKVPVNRTNQFELKAVNFFKYWPKDTVLLNGKEPSRIDGLWLNDHMVLVDGLSHDYVVMGNVPYRVGAEYCAAGSGYYNHYGIVTFIEIGTASFTPNREDLRYDSTTKNTLASIKKTFQASINTVLNNELAASKTHGEAFRKFVEFKNKYASIPGVTLAPKWNGKDIPSTIKVTHQRFQPHANRYQMSTHSSIYPGDLSHFERSIFVINVTPSSITSSHKAKMREMISTLPGRIETIYLFDDQQIIPEWLSDFKTVEWEDVAAIKLTHATGGRRGVQHVKQWINDRLVPVKEIDSNVETYYYSPTDDWAVNAAQIIANILPDVQILMLGANRFDKLCREVPNAKPLHDVAKDLAKEFVNSLSSDEKKALVLPDRDLLRKMDASKIEDPELAEYVRLASINIYDLSVKQSRLIRIGCSPSLDSIPNILYDRYCLNMRHSYTSAAANKQTLEHFYVYLNAAYHAFYEGNKND